jgi:hypothetical protein
MMKALLQTIAVLASMMVGIASAAAQESAPLIMQQAASLERQLAALDPGGMIFEPASREPAPMSGPQMAQEACGSGYCSQGYQCCVVLFQETCAPVGQGGCIRPQR